LNESYTTLVKYFGELITYIKDISIDSSLKTHVYGFLNEKYSIIKVVKGIISHYLKEGNAESYKLVKAYLKDTFVKSFHENISIELNGKQSQTNVFGNFLTDLIYSCLENNKKQKGIVDEFISTLSHYSNISITLKKVDSNVRIVKINFKLLIGFSGSLTNGFVEKIKNWFIEKRTAKFI
jgi:hypothetical protein